MGRRTISSKKLIGVAFYQLLHRYDFDKITIKQICDKAGVSRMSFYRYYTSKEDVFLVFSDEKFENFFQLASESNIDNPYDLFLLVFKQIKKQEKSIKLLERTGKFNLLFSSFEQYASYLSARFKGKGLVYYKGNKFAVPFLAGGIYSIVYRWCHRDFIGTPEEVTKSLMQIIDGSKQNQIIGQ